MSVAEKLVSALEKIVELQRAAMDATIKQLSEARKQVELEKSGDRKDDTPVTPAIPVTPARFFSPVAAHGTGGDGIVGVREHKARAFKDKEAPPTPGIALGSGDSDIYDTHCVVCGNANHLCSCGAYRDPNEEDDHDYYAAHQRLD